MTAGQKYFRMLIRHGNADGESRFGLQWTGETGLSGQRALQLKKRLKYPTVDRKSQVK